MRLTLEVDLEPEFNYFDGILVNIDKIRDFLSDVQMLLVDPNRFPVPDTEVFSKETGVEPPVYYHPFQVVYDLKDYSHDDVFPFKYCKMVLPSEK